MMDYAEIKKILGSLADPVERLEFVMDLGAQIPLIPENRTATEISGCASRVEVYDDGDGNYYGNADSALVRGVLAVLLSMAQGKTRDEIRKMDLTGEFKGLNLGLGAGRMNGVAGIINYLTKDAS
jgi:cysteine desulfuration protein SufE